MPIIDLSNNNKLVQHAERELALAGLTNPSNPAYANIANRALSLVRLMSTQNHTPSTMQMTLSLLTALANFQLLSPLTDKPEEWHSEKDGKRVNKRMPSVYMDAEGKVWNTAAIAWELPGKGIFTGEIQGGYTSTQPLMLPCYPQMVKIELNEDESLKHPEQYQEVVDYFAGTPAPEAESNEC